MITVSSLGLPQMWRMAGQDGSGASRERGRERLCSGNQGGGFDQSSGLIEPEMCVCVRQAGGSCVSPCVSHLCMYKAYVCGICMLLCLFLTEQIVEGATCLLCLTPKSEWAWSSCCCAKYVNTLT